MSDHEVYVDSLIGNCMRRPQDWMLVATDEATGWSVLQHMIDGGEQIIMPPLWHALALKEANLAPCRETVGMVSNMGLKKSKENTVEGPFLSDIVLGKKYRDKHTGFEGHATCVVFYLHGCERVTLKGKNTQGEIVEYGFDSPEVEDVETQETPVARKVGGPHGSAPMSRR